MSVKQPGIKWAERKDCLYLTMTHAECQDVVFKFDDSCKVFDLSFSRKNGDKYELKLNLLHEIKVSESRFKNNRYVEFKLVKEKEQIWGKLYTGGKMKNVQVDWNKWVDEDDEEPDTYDWNKSGEGQAMDFLKKKKYDKENVDSSEALKEMTKKLAEMKANEKDDVLGDLDDPDDDDDDVPSLEDVD